MCQPKQGGQTKVFQFPRDSQWQGQGWGSTQHGQCSQHLHEEGVELVCAQRIRAGDAPAAESSCSREVPCQCRGEGSGGTASTFPWAALGFQLGGKAGKELADGRDETSSGDARESQESTLAKEGDRWQKNGGRDEMRHQVIIQ